MKLKRVFYFIACGISLAAVLILTGYQFVLLQEAFQGQSIFEWFSSKNIVNLRGLLATVLRIVIDCMAILAFYKLLFDWRVRSAISYRPGVLLSRNLSIVFFLLLILYLSGYEIIVNAAWLQDETAQYDGVAFTQTAQSVRMLLQMDIVQCVMNLLAAVCVPICLCRELAARKEEPAVPENHPKETETMPQ